jgi:hypothetical protein
MNTDTPAMTTKKMSKSEMVVAGLAVAVLVAGFATGVFAKPVQTDQHGPWLSAHVATVQIHQQD